MGPKSGYSQRDKLVESDASIRAEWHRVARQSPDLSLGGLDPTGDEPRLALVPLRIDAIELAGKSALWPPETVCPEGILAGYARTPGFIPFLVFLIPIGF